VKGSRQDFLKGTVKLVVLATLADTPKYGYLIIKEIEGLSNDFFDLREGTLYPILHRLEDEGYVKSEWKVSKVGRDRRYYRITPKGRQFLQSQRQVLQKTVSAVNAVTVSIKARIAKEGDWYVARCLKPDVVSQGRTIEEVRANLKEAVQLYFESFGPEDAPETRGEIVFYPLGAGAHG